MTVAPAPNPDPTLREGRLQLLRRLYAEQLTCRSDEYLQLHGSPSFMRGTEQVFDWYRRYLPATGKVLDWGCRHAPDACLLSADDDFDLTIYGCDVVEPDRYKIFHSAAELQYKVLDHEYALSYENATFDAVIAAGVLEHVPMEYESLKELSRVTKPGGVLVITFLPNSRSLHELRARRSTTSRHTPGVAHHLRTYQLKTVRRALQACGFEVEQIGYQTHFDLLDLEPFAPQHRRLISAVGRHTGAGRVAPCLALTARRLSYF